MVEQLLIVWRRNQRNAAIAEQAASGKSGREESEDIIGQRMPAISSREIAESMLSSLESPNFL